MLSPQRKEAPLDWACCIPLDRDDNDETEEVSGVHESEPGQRHHLEHRMEGAAEERPHRHTRDPAEAVHHRRQERRRWARATRCQAGDAPSGDPLGVDDLAVLPIDEELDSTRADVLRPCPVLVEEVDLVEVVDHHRYGLGVTGASDAVSLESVV